MKRDEVVTYCLTKPASFEDYPFEPDLLVIKVGVRDHTRIFAMFGLDRRLAADHVSLRCWPEDLEAWRATYPQSIGTTPYMRTKAWNTVLLDGSVNPDDVLEMVDISYDSAVASLPKKHRPRGMSGATA